MKKWLTFFGERTPLASYFLMTMGPVASAYALAVTPIVSGLYLSFIGFFLFFIVLRMMDEYKDYSKDVLAHPSRPLPRGLIALPEFKWGITIGMILLIVFDISMLLMGYIGSFYLYSLVILHLWLMYKEFYVSEWINARPLFYAVTHQLILITLCLFCISVQRPLDPLSFDKLDLVYSFSVLFAFFSYEVCRKLNPASHPVLKTYLSIYGINGVIKIVTTLLMLHFIAIRIFFSNEPTQGYFAIPLVVLFLSLVALKYNKIKFSVVELIATLNLLIFLYSGILYVIAD